LRWPLPSEGGSGQRGTRTAKVIREITFAVRGIDTAPLKESYEHQGM
jgi:hypothetical protein